MKFMIKNWYRIGAIVGIIVLVMLISGLIRPTAMQLLLLINLLCLFAHQFEEYQLPGGAPLIINRTVYNETTIADRYPGNSLSIMTVNVSAWVIYSLAIYWSQVSWLALGVIMFSLFQIAGHCLEMPIKLRAWYNPGMVTTIILFLPLGIVAIHYMVQQHLLTGSDWLLAVLTLVGCILITIVAPVQLLKDKHTKYPIDHWQVKRFEQVMHHCRF